MFRLLCYSHVACLLVVFVWRQTASSKRRAVGVKPRAPAARRPLLTLFAARCLWLAVCGSLLVARRPSAQRLPIASQIERPFNIDTQPRGVQFHLWPSFYQLQHKCYQHCSRQPRLNGTGKSGRGRTQWLQWLPLSHSPLTARWQPAALVSEAKG